MLDFNFGIFDGTISAAGVPSGTAITASRASTQVLDIQTSRDLGADAMIELHVDVTAAFATLTSLAIAFQASADNVTYYDILDSVVIPVAQLIKGAPIFRYKWPLNQVLNAAAGVLNAPGRYYRFNYTVAGSNATAGAVFAYANAKDDRVQQTIYPRNYSLVTTAADLA
jgi:hypothetical protein